MALSQAGEDPTEASAAESHRRKAGARPFSFSTVGEVGFCLSVSVVTRMRTVDEIMERLGDISIAEVLQACCAEAKTTAVEQFGPCGNLYIRPMRFPEVGSIVRGHTHQYDHLTVVFTGSVNLRACDVLDSGKMIEMQVKAPAWIRVAKGWWHELTALEPGTRADCVFALRDSDGSVTDVASGIFDESKAG
jgi:hypothetical protein